MSEGEVFAHVFMALCDHFQISLDEGLATLDAKLPRSRLHFGDGPKPPPCGYGDDVIEYDWTGSRRIRSIRS